MTNKILCPGKRLYLVLEAIDNPLVYKRIEEEAKRKISYESMRQGFPNLSEDQIKNLYFLAKAEHLQYSGAYLLLRRYASAGTTNNPIINISSVLAKHVKECRKKRKCLDKFMLWCERKARTEMNEQDEDGLPGLIRRIDFRTLDLGVF